MLSFLPSLLLPLLPLLPLFTLTLTSATPTPPTHSKRFSSVRIQSNRRPGFCLGTEFVRGPRPGIGVTLVNCNEGATILWEINRGPGQVRVGGGTTLVLDARENPGNFGRLSTENYVPGASSQNWYYTDDNRIAITGGNQCLDDDGSRLQTYQCTTRNTNQIFNILFPNDPPPPPPPPQGADPYPDIPRGTVYPDQSNIARRVHPFNRGDLCLTVMGNSVTAGNGVAIAYCVPDSDPSAKYQIFDPSGTASRVSGPFPLTQNRSFCLSADPANGGRVSIQPCGSARKWQYDNGGQRILLEGQAYCLDVRRESRPENGSPVRSVRSVQTWECGIGNPQQQWTFLW